MLFLFFLSKLLCQYVQTLVFGSETDNGVKTHYCDFTFSPYSFVNNVTIFQLLEEGTDRAVPCCNIKPYPKTKLSKYFRIEIPSDLARKGVEYSFQFEILDEDPCYSEPWAFDPSKGTFCLASATTRSFFDNPVYLVGAGAAVVLGAGLIGAKLYRRSRRSKNVV